MRLVILPGLRACQHCFTTVLLKPREWLPTTITTRPPQGEQVRLAIRRRIQEIHLKIYRWCVTPVLSLCPLLGACPSQTQQQSQTPQEGEDLSLHRKRKRQNKKNPYLYLTSLLHRRQSEEDQTGILASVDSEGPNYGTLR